MQTSTILSRLFSTLLAGLLIGASVSAAPSGGSRSDDRAERPSNAERFFERGTALLLEERYRPAERQLRRAVEAKDDYAEAHNNLAFVLRKQGEDHFEAALEHYNRAIELNPDLAEAYMYRGVLYVQMGKLDKALADHAKLLELDESLAAELQYVVGNGEEKTPAQFFGVVQKKE